MPDEAILLAAVVVVVLDVSCRPLTQLPAPEPDDLAEIPFVLVRQEVQWDKAVALATPDSFCGISPWLAISVTMLQCWDGKTNASSLEDLLILGIGRGARHMAVLPGAELVDDEEHTVIAPCFGNLLVDERKPLLEFAAQTALGRFRAHEFLTELPDTGLRPVFFRCTYMFPAEEIRHARLFVVARLLRILALRGA